MKKIGYFLLKGNFIFYFSIAMFLIDFMPQFTPYINKFMFILPAWGGMYLLVNFKFILKNMNRYLIALLLFIGVYSITILFYFNLNLTGGIKSIIWQVYFIFVIFVGGFGGKINFLYFNYIVIGISSLCNVYALYMFINSIVYRISGSIVGFGDGRLYGFFRDPNHASFISLVVLLMILYNYFKEKRYKALFIVLFIINYSFILLSGSRGGLIGLITIFSLFSFYHFYHFKPKTQNNYLVAITKIIMFIVLIISCVGINTIWEKTLFSLPNILNELNSSENRHVNKNNTSTDENQLTDSNVPKEEEKNASGNDIDQDSNNLSTSKVGRVDSKESTSVRLAILKETIALSSEHLLLGVGDRNYTYFALENPTQYKYLSTGAALHNGYTSLLLFSGLPNTLIILSTIVTILLNIVIQLFKSKNNALFISLLVCIACLISALTLSEIFFNVTVLTFIFWLYLGELLRNSSSLKKVK